eukprot:5783455-Alexandrium_andersonii.AAC.1
MRVCTLCHGAKYTQRACTGVHHRVCAAMRDGWFATTSLGGGPRCRSIARRPQARGKGRTPESG